MKPITKVVLAIIALLIAFAISIPLVNNHTAYSVADELSSLPLPESTELLDSVSLAGKLVGNGNGMQFFGAVLIRSDLTLAELDAHYSVFRENEWDCIVEPQQGNVVDIIEHASLSFSTEVPAEGCYIVYSWGGGIEPFASLDIRGH